MKYVTWDRLILSGEIKWKRKMTSIYLFMGAKSGLHTYCSLTSNVAYMWGYLAPMGPNLQVKAHKKGSASASYDLGKAQSQHG